jgi:flagellar biosynthesis/type III secretory pathway M-ring protein FliF/YscJ
MSEEAPTPEKVDSNVAAAAVAISEAITNKPPEHSRRKTDGVAYTINDFERAVAVMKEEADKAAQEATQGNLFPDAETIEAIGELEDKRLTHWFIKAVGGAILFLMGMLIVAVIYSTVTGSDVIIPEFLTSSLGSIKEIVLAILETKG